MASQIKRLLEQSATEPHAEALRIKRGTCGPPHAADAALSLITACKKMRLYAAALLAATSAIDWDAPGAERATLATLEGYPPPTCVCAAEVAGSVDDVVDALLDPGTHHTWVSRLDESVVLAKDGAELVADADDAQVVYYRFALPFPCWDRQVSAALYCDRTEEGGAKVELRRVSLPPPSKLKKRRRKRRPRGDRVVGWTTAAAERFVLWAPPVCRRVGLSTPSSSH